MNTTDGGRGGGGPESRGSPAQGAAAGVELPRQVRLPVLPPRNHFVWPFGPGKCHWSTSCGAASSSVAVRLTAWQAIDIVPPDTVPLSQWGTPDTTQVPAGCSKTYFMPSLLKWLPGSKCDAVARTSEPTCTTPECDGF